MRIAIDTNWYTAFCKGNDDCIDIVQRAHEIYLPFVTLAELRAGFACGAHSHRNEALLVRFLNKPRVNLLHSTDTTTRSYANLFRQLRHQGTPIPTNDLWIAALCVQHDLLLASHDQHFEHLPQIPRI